MSFAIMRIAKIKATNIIGVDKHNERKNNNYSNEDIKQELTHLNYDLIKCPSYKKKINEELDKRYTSSRSIRKDAVLGVEVIFTSDNEFFKKLSPEQERLYFEKSLEFLQDFASKENVISAVVHKDETTPHMHCVFTPITQDGRLHFKSFVDGKFEMSKFQDKYYEKMKEFFPELERGKSSEETQRKHLSVEQYKFEKEKEKLNEIKTNLETVKKEQTEREEEIKKINDFADNFYSVGTIVEKVQEKKVLLSSDTYKITAKELASLTALATTSEKNKNELNKLNKKYTEMEEDLNRYKSQHKKYLSLTEDLTKFKEKFEDYSKRLEEALPIEKLKEIQEENLSYLKIKKLTNRIDTEKYLVELEKIGYKNLNKVDKKFVEEKSKFYDTAKYILNKEKITEKTTEKPNKLTEWQKQAIRSRQRGFGRDD